MKWIVLPYSNSYSEETKCINVIFIHFPLIQKTNKQTTFENMYESSIIFQSFLYANTSAESPSYAPTFFESPSPKNA